MSQMQAAGGQPPRSSRASGRYPPGGNKSRLPSKCGLSKGGAQAPGKKQAGKQASKQAKPKAPDVSALPAFSLALPPPTSFMEQEKEKQKIIRRNKPKGEDTNKLKEIVNSVRERPTNAHEFIGLVAPSTADNGKTLRTVLGDEMSLFRTTTRKIYETMTEDVSDVLVNEQVQLKEYTTERNNINEDKLQRMLNEVLDMCPEFDFDLFYTREGYLDELFPAAEVDIDQDEMEAFLRQEAYHRYQWLKSEGDRMKEENSRLQKRLKELKKRQKDQLDGVNKKEQKADEKRKILEAAQEVLEERLDELTESLAKNLVKSELASMSPISLRPVPPEPSVTDKLNSIKAGRQKAPWASQQAAEIEANRTREALHAEVSKVSLRSKETLGKKKSKGRVPKRRQRFQPPGTPPNSQPSGSPQKSPFHYSPPKTPPEAAWQQQEDEHTRMNISTSRSVVEEQPQSCAWPQARRY